MFWNKKEKFKAPQVTDDNFNDLVSTSEVPVLLDFYADWCGPCKMLGPIIDELAEAYEGKALVAKVNTEQNPGLSQHFKIKSIPALFVINKGHVQERFNGIIPKPNLEEILDEYIATTDEKGRLARNVNAEEEE